MNKPLHKDPSFWIVAVVSLGFAVWGQWTVGAPWVTARLKEMKPAERMPVPDRPSSPFDNPQRPELDFTKKTHPWQRPQYDPQALAEAEPQVVIIPSEYTGFGGGGWSTSSEDGAIGIRVGAQQIMAAAHGWNQWQRIVQPPDLDRTAAYDFLVKDKENPFEKLRNEAEAKLGLVAEKVSITTNAYLLVVRSKEAPGLRPFDPAAAGQPQPANKPGIQTVRGFDVPNLTRFVEQAAKAPVLDRTELTERYEMDLPQELFGGPVSGQIEKLRKLLGDNYGLDLVATNAPVEFLVIRKTAATR